MRKLWVRELERLAQSHTDKLMVQLEIDTEFQRFLHSFLPGPQYITHLFTQQVVITEHLLCASL